MADFFFKTAVGDGGDYIIKGPNWVVNWDAGRLTSRAIEAARLAIDDANEAAAEEARTNHPWNDRTFQTEESVIVFPAHLNKARQQVWGSWGINNYPREPPRMNMPDNPAYEERYGGRLLSTKDVALLLEFGFTTQVGWEGRGEGRRPGNFVQFPWLYPAWDAEKGTVLTRMKRYYNVTGGAPRPKKVFLESAWPGAKVAFAAPTEAGTGGGWFISLGPYYIYPGEPGYE